MSRWNTGSCNGAIAGNSRDWYSGSLPLYVTTLVFVFFLSFILFFLSFWGLVYLSCSFVTPEDHSIKHHVYLAALDNLTDVVSRHHLRMRFIVGIYNVTLMTTWTWMFTVFSMLSCKLMKAMRALYFVLLATILFLELIHKLVLFGSFFPLWTASFSLMFRSSRPPSICCFVPWVLHG